MRQPIAWIALVIALAAWVPFLLPKDPPPAPVASPVAAPSPEEDEEEGDPLADRVERLESRVAELMIAKSLAERAAIRQQAAGAAPGADAGGGTAVPEADLRTEVAAAVQEVLAAEATREEAARAERRSQMRQAWVAETGKALGLSESQQGQVQAWANEVDAQRRQIREQRQRGELDRQQARTAERAVAQSFDEKVAASLTPEQKVAYDKLEPRDRRPPGMGGPPRGGRGGPGE